MDRLRIRGNRPLHGRVQISGAKNAALPILIASLLSERALHLKRVPVLQDIFSTIELLAHLGVRIDSTHFTDRNEVSLQAPASLGLEAPYDLVRKMRASVLVLGPILARHGFARVSLPGGCAIGARPIDIHLSGFEKMGAEITLKEGYVEARAPGGRLKGAVLPLGFPSVGATENLLMAATLAEGETIIENAAQEPEIKDLAECLRAMGAEIAGEGTSRIRIQGKKTLGKSIDPAAEYAVLGDRIEAGTYLMAGFMTGGKVRAEGIRATDLESVLQKLEESGAQISREPDAIVLSATERPRPVSMTTAPFPGFPTDMQAQLVALLSIATGTSLITETIFENRFMHVPELCRLGADLTVRGNTVTIVGRERLIGAPVMATDLRASASLVLAGLRAEGETILNRIYHLDRGYERLEEKLRELGADVVREG